jgi:hypothetical protein
MLVSESRGINQSEILLLDEDPDGGQFEDNYRARYIEEGQPLVNRGPNRIFENAGMVMSEPDTNS